MIFLSHNHKDKKIVQQIALKLRAIYGQKNIFYDSWSIQPGDGIVDKMSEGLGKCKLFLFFVSNNSLQSKMVELEWQNAVMKSTYGEIKIIPVKLDACLMPPILVQSLYIDLFGNGLEVATRQIVDVLSGKNSFSPGPQEFSNLRAYRGGKGQSIYIEIRAEHYLEPISHYMFLTNMARKDFKLSYKSGPMRSREFKENITLENGKTINCEICRVEKATVPGFPFIVEITSPTNKEITLEGVLHEKKTGKWQGIPLVNGQSNI